MLKTMLQIPIKSCFGESNILFGKHYGKQNVRLSPQPLCLHFLAMRVSVGWDCKIYAENGPAFKGGLF